MAHMLRTLMGDMAGVLIRREGSMGLAATDGRWAVRPLIIGLPRSAMIDASCVPNGMGYTTWESRTRSNGDKFARGACPNGTNGSSSALGAASCAPHAAWSEPCTPTYSIVMHLGRCRRFDLHASSRDAMCSQRVAAGLRARGMPASATMCTSVFYLPHRPRSQCGASVQGNRLP
jgi:hypothetical protein